MSFPVHDWQFWVVTAAALVAALWMIRDFLPFAALKRRRKARRHSRRATLTVKGKPPTHTG